jgi:hypothetical protein
MENQHRQIKGYRELSEDEIRVMNAIKETAAVVGNFVDSLGSLDSSSDFSIDKRWLSIARTDLQKGFMALTRCVAKPEFF